MISQHQLARKLATLERNRRAFKDVFDAIRELMSRSSGPQSEWGFNGIPELDVHGRTHTSLDSPCFCHQFLRSFP